MASFIDTAKNFTSFTSNYTNFEQNYLFVASWKWRLYTCRLTDWKILSVAVVLPVGGLIEKSYQVSPLYIRYRIMERVRWKATAKMIDYNNIHTFNFFSNTFHTPGKLLVKKTSSHVIFPTSEAFHFYFCIMRGTLPCCNFWKVTFTNKT